MPQICWHTIFTWGKPQWYGKPLKQRGLLSRKADIRRGSGASRIAFLCARTKVFGLARSLPRLMNERCSHSPAASPKRGPARSRGGQGAGTASAAEPAWPGLVDCGLLGRDRGERRPACLMSIEVLTIREPGPPRRAAPRTSPNPKCLVRRHSRNSTREKELAALRRSDRQPPQAKRPPIGGRSLCVSCGAVN